MFKQFLATTSQNPLKTIYDKYSSYIKEKDRINNRYHRIIYSLFTVTLIPFAPVVIGDFLNLLPQNIAPIVVAASAFFYMVIWCAVMDKKHNEIYSLWENTTLFLTIKKKPELLELLKQLEKVQLEANLYEIEEIIAEIKLSFLKNDSLSTTTIDKLYHIINNNYDSITSTDKINKEDKLLLQENLLLEMEIGQTNVQKIL